MQSHSGSNHSHLCLADMFSLCWLGSTTARDGCPKMQGWPFLFHAIHCLRRGERGLVLRAFCGPSSVSVDSCLTSILSMWDVEAGRGMSRWCTLSNSAQTSPTRRPFLEAVHDTKIDSWGVAQAEQMSLCPRSEVYKVSFSLLPNPMSQ
jgi:hypothetical protein